MSSESPVTVNVLDQDPATYRPHALHEPSRSYVETNCYTDILIELLHARGLEPLAMLGYLARVDFEGDQWTFFKPPPADLEELYGIDIHEMQPFRPLHLQMAEQLAAGNTVIVELDAFHLPDTAATSYGVAHVKTSVAAAGIDLSGERLRYFHNTSLHELGGADYRAVLRTVEGWQGEVLPPYTELVRFGLRPALEGDALRDAARTLLAGHLALRPADNPFRRFEVSFEETLPGLVERDVQAYHDYVFATFRMAGAAFEVLSSHARWIAPGDDRAVDALGRIVSQCKLMSLKLARRRVFDAGPAFAELSAAWDDAVTALDDLVA